MPRTKIAVAPGRVEPLAELPDGARTVWREIVDALPADHFGPQDRALLAQYCHAAWRHRLEVKKDRRKVGAAALAVVRDTVAVLGKLGPQLRLAPSSRIDAERAGSARRRARTQLQPEAEKLTDWRAAMPGRLDS